MKNVTFGNFSISDKRILMKNLALSLFTLLFSLCAFGQATISGKVTDSTGENVPFATVEILNPEDSLLLTGLVCDSVGYFEIGGAPPGTYLVRISSFGFNDWYSGPVKVSGSSEVIVTPIQMTPESTDIDGVTVTGYRPTIVFQNGSMIVDVQNNPMNAGNSVLDVLRNIPGVTVDGSGNIMVNGKSGVGILFDDRLQQIPAAQISQILASMPAESVKEIELIKNPSSKYDAKGVSGLINIRSKQMATKGFNCSIGTTNSMGNRFRNSNNFSLNIKRERFSVFTNVAYSYNHLWTSTQFDRTLADTLTINALQIGDNRNSSLNLNGGIEFDLTPKSVIGLNVNGNLGNNRLLNTSTTDVNDSTGLGYNYFTNSTGGREKLLFATAGLFFNHQFDSLGSTLSYSGDISNFDYRLPQNNTNYFYLTNGQESDPSIGYLNDINLDFLILTNKLDYSKVFNNKWTLELGVKNSIVNNTNDLKLESSLGGNPWTLDSSLTNYFEYDEMINAGYVSVRYTLAKFVLNGGLRTEQTILSGNNRTTGQVIDRNYVNFFPNFSVDFQPNPKHMMQLSYSYRIDRPAFEQMVPGKIFNNQLSYAVGNPLLLPQYSHNINFEHYFQNTIGNSINFTHIDNSIFGYTYSRDDSQLSVDTTINFATRDMVAYTLMIQMQPSKFYRFQFSGMMVLSAFNGSVNNASISTLAAASSLSLANDFFLPKGYRLQLNMRLQTPFREGIQYSSAIGSVTLAVRKKFFQDRLSTVLGISDLFFTDYGTVTVDLPGQRSLNTQMRDSRRVTVSLLYSFGSMRFDKKLISDENEGSGRIKRNK